MRINFEFIERNIISIDSIKAKMNKKIVLMFSGVDDNDD